MTEPILKSEQARLLFRLLFKHGECWQNELVPEIAKKDREALETARLITRTRAGQRNYLKLEDAGWAWAAAHLDVDLLPKQPLLKDLLARLAEHLARTGGTFAEFIGAKPVPDGSPGAQTMTKTRRSRAKAKRQNRPMRET